MAERRMIMHAELIGATRNGKKTYSRRPKNLAAANENPNGWRRVEILPELGHKGCTVARFTAAASQQVVLETCPYGAVGDVLWITEPHLLEAAYPSAPPESPRFGKKRAVYWLDKAPAVRKSLRWRDSRAMPREHCRTFAEVLEIGIERYDEITEVDAIDEGFLTMSDDWLFQTFAQYAVDLEKWAAQGGMAAGIPPPVGPTPKQRYQAFMAQCYAPEYLATNPWLWVVKFKMLNDYKP